MHSSQTSLFHQLPNILPGIFSVVTSSPFSIADFEASIAAFRISKSILPKLMFLSFIIFNYSTPRKVSSLLRYAMLPHVFLSFHVHLLQLLLLSLTNFNFTTPRVEPGRVSRHLYELHVVGQKNCLSSTPLKPAEPTPQSVYDKNHTKQGRVERNDLIRFNE